MGIVYGRNYGFNERKLGVKQVKVFNAGTRDWAEQEFVYANGFFGEVRNTSVNQGGGIPAGSWGYINVDLERIIETLQYKAGEAFARADSEAAVYVYFTPQTASAEGFFIDGVTTVVGSGDVKVGVLYEAKTAGDTNAMAFKPLGPVGNLEVTA